MGADARDIDPVGVIRPDLQDVPQSGRAGNTFFRIGYMVDDPPYRTKVWGFTSQGGLSVGGGVSGTRYIGSLVIYVA